MSKTTWDDLITYCTEQCEIISQTIPFAVDPAKQSFVEFLEMLFAAEIKYREPAAHAATHFINTGEWPEQNAWVAHFNFQRMLCAAEFAAQMRTCDHSGFVPKIPASLTHVSLLTWLCIDHWERCYDVWIKLYAVSLFFSLPFYGLEPVFELDVNLIRLVLRRYSPATPLPPGVR
jgi:hypothetical protein